MRRRHRTARALPALLVLVSLATAGCGAEAQLLSGSDGTAGTAPSGTVTRTPATDAPIALIQTDHGLSGVPVGTALARWTVPGAVAAPDGSAVFVVDDPDATSTELHRIDPRTGAELATWTVAGPTHVAAVSNVWSVNEPGTPRVNVVLSHTSGATDAAQTTVQRFDVDAGRVVAANGFDGVLDPEGLSTYGDLVFAARVYGEGKYHVHVLNLTSGAQWPTVGPDKTSSPEDMYGHVVQAAVRPVDPTLAPTPTNPEGEPRQLATLYRDTIKPGHTGFVHLLWLDGGTTICIDLHEPFGTGPAGSDAIGWVDGEIVVTHTDAATGAVTLATFDPDSDIWADDGGATPEHFHADPRPATPTEIAAATLPTVPPAVANTPTFRRFIALAR